MLSNLLKAGDIVVCKYFNIEHPNRRWFVYDVDLINQRIYFRSVVNDRTWSQRASDFYEVDAMIQQGYMRVIPEENIF